MTLPASLTLIPVHGRIIHTDAIGSPATGTVKFTIGSPLRTNDHVICGPTTITVGLDVTGAFTVSLPATDDPDVTPQGWTYQVSVNTNALTDTWRISVPIATVGTLELADIAPAVSPPALITYVLASTVGQVGGPAGPLGSDGLVPSSQLPTTSGGAGPSPATGVSDGTTFGVTKTVGTSVKYAREEHSHGTPATPTAASVGADASGTATAAVATHAGTTTNVHGITDTAALETSSGATTKVSTHTGAADPHGDRAAASSALTTHTGATDPHADRAYTDTQVSAKLAKASNLSDLQSAVTAASNLGIPDVSALYPSAARLPKWVQPSSVITTMQTGHGWTSSGTGAVFNLNDTTAGAFIIGSQAATATTGGAGAQTNIRKFAGTIADTTGKVVRLRLKVEDVTHLNELDFYLGTSSLASNYKWSFHIGGASAWITSGDWCTVTLSFADAIVTGTPARSGLTDAQLQIWDDNTANPVTVHLQSVELIPDGSTVFPNGVASICFDDSWSSPRDLSWAKLDGLGYPASLFTITDLIGTNLHLTLADVKTRVDRFGWESAAHANLDANHTATYTGLTASALDADIRAQRAWLLTNGIRSADGTAYPLGQFGRTSNALSTTDVVRRYCSWARTTSRRGAETFPPADPFRLRAVSSITTFTGGVTPTSLTTATTGTIDKAKANGAWLVLVFHKIVSGAAASTTECQQSDFNAIIDKITSAGMPVMTIGDVLRYNG